MLHTHTRQHGLLSTAVSIDCDYSTDDMVCTCAGDALAIALPLGVDAVVIYLGIVLAGCVVVSIADSFAAEEVATRLRIARARAIFTQARACVLHHHAVHYTTERCWG
jgi:acyl-coenzyme A synthetase/AMP-(fatty) acid ligase